MPLTRARRQRNDLVPWLEKDEADATTLWKTFARTQAVAVRNYVSGDMLKKSFGRAHLEKLFEAYPDRVKKTWNVENGDGSNCKPEVILNRKSATSVGGTWYCSFIVQDNEDFLDRTLNSLPFSALTSRGSKVAVHRRCCWFFMGQNLKGTSMRGRPEHTDAVTGIHATWHLQLRGEKIWYLRPTEEVGLGRNAPSVRVVCRAGDLILVNTCMWWHRTEIPSTLACRDRVSLSVARDVTLKNREEEEEEEEAGLSKPGVPITSSNIECVYAPHRISKGSVVLTEDDLPDCELPTCASPNCEVAETEDGVGVLLAARDIESGEVFTIAR